MTVAELHRRLEILISWGLENNHIFYVEKKGDTRQIDYQWRETNDDGEWEVMLG